MTMIGIVLVLLLFQITCSVSIPVEGAICKFPKFLLNKPRWETEIKDEHQSTGKIVRFAGNSMLVTDLTTLVPKEETYDIVQCDSNTKIILKQKDQRNYHCIDVIQRSKYIFQWKKSKASNTFNSSLCNDDNLVLDKWPLVWPFLDEPQYEISPFSGGYRMQIYDNEAGSYLCEDYWIAPQLESECIKGEGIQLNFRHFDCIGTLGMEMLQDLFSLGTWTQGNFEFSILINADDLWPRLWITRTSKGAKTESKFDVDIFSEVATEVGFEPDISNKYYTWSLTKLTGDCEDEAKPTVCTAEGAIHKPCDEFRQTYCKKSCGVCLEPVTKVDQCDLIENIQGVWGIYDQSKDVKKVIFQNCTMNLPNDLPSFHCFNTTEKMWLKSAKRKPLVVSYGNGCQPRYVCLQAENKAPDVLSYMLSQVSKFEISDNITIKADYICSDKKFVLDKHTTFKNPFWQNEIPQILIKEGEDDHKRKGVNCGARESVNLNPMDEKYGWGVLNIGGLDVLNKTCMSTSNPTFSDTSFHLNAWHCLSHFQKNLDEFLIVETDNIDIDLKVQCWITHRNEWSSDAHFYVVSPSVCNYAIPNLVQVGSYRDYLAAYKIEATPVNKVVPCQFIEKLEPNTTSAPTISTSSPMKSLATQNIPPSGNNSDVYHLKTGLVVSGQSKCVMVNVGIACSVMFIMKIIM